MSGSSENKNLEIKRSLSSQEEIYEPNVENTEREKNHYIKPRTKRLSTRALSESGLLSKKTNTTTKEFDYAKNLETIKNKLKLLNIAQKISLENRENNPLSCVSTSSSSMGYQPRRSNEKILNAPLSPVSFISSGNSKKHSMNTSEKKNIYFSPYKSSSESENVRSGKSRSSRSSQTITLYSPRRKIYFTSTSMTNSSKSGCSLYLSKECAQKKEQEYSNYRAKFNGNTSTTSVSSRSTSPKKTRHLTKSRPKLKTNSNKSNQTIVQVLNKVCMAKYEPYDGHFAKERSKRLSSSSSLEETEFLQNRIDHYKSDKVNVLGKTQKTKKVEDIKIKSPRAKLLKNKLVKVKHPSSGSTDQSKYSACSFQSLEISDAHNIICQRIKKYQSMLSKSKPPINSKPRTRRNEMDDLSSAITIRSNIVSARSSISQKSRRNSAQTDNSSPEKDKPMSRKQYPKSPVTNELLDRKYSPTKTKMNSIEKFGQIPHEYEYKNSKQKCVQKNSLNSNQNNVKSIINPYKFPFPSLETPKSLCVSELSNKSKDSSCFSAVNEEKCKNDLTIKQKIKKKAPKLNRKIAKDFNAKKAENRLQKQRKTSKEKNQYLSSLTRCKNFVETMFINLSYSNPSIAQSETLVSTEEITSPIPAKKLCIREGSEYDVFQFVVDNDNNSIASSCTTPPKKRCLRNKTPEISDNVETIVKEEKSSISGVSKSSSNHDSSESSRSDEFKNSIVSLLLEWRQKEAQCSTGTNNEAKRIESNSVPKLQLETFHDKYLTECENSNCKDDTDNSQDLEEFKNEQQLSVISEETRVISEEDISSGTNLHGIFSREQVIKVQESNNLTENEAELIESKTGEKGTSDFCQQCIISVNDASTSEQDLKIRSEDKETCCSITCKDVEVQYNSNDSICSDSKTFVNQNVKDEDFCGHSSKKKNDRMFSCFTMPFLTKKVFEAIEVSFGNGDQQSMSLKTENQPKLQETLGTTSHTVGFLKIGDDGDKKQTQLPRSISRVSENSLEQEPFTLNPMTSVSLDVPRRFSCLYQFPAITRITMISGDFEDLISLRKDDDAFLPEIKRSTETSLNPVEGKNPSEEINWNEIITPKQAIDVKQEEEVDQKTFAVLYRSKSFRKPFGQRSDSSSNVCHCHDHATKKKGSMSDVYTIENSDDESLNTGCFSCFLKIFATKKRRFFDDI